MAWTTPRTWIAGEEVTAALLNAQIRDNLLETMAAKATTNQDLFQGTAANAVARIAIGSAGQAFQVLTSSTIGWGAAPTAIPAGVIVFHTGGSCPAGWAEVTTARGRVLVGLPSGGTLAGTVGAALVDLGTRTLVGSALNAAHTHAVGSYAASTSSTHTHTFLTGTGGGGNVTVDMFTTADRATVSSQSNGGHTHTITGATGSTGVGGVDATAPYIQLIVCQKS